MIFRDLNFASRPGVLAWLRAAGKLQKTDFLILPRFKLCHRSADTLAIEHRNRDLTELRMANWGRAVNLVDTLIDWTDKGDNEQMVRTSSGVDVRKT